jgi:hypothetical protein
MSRINLHRKIKSKMTQSIRFLLFAFLFCFDSIIANDLTDAYIIIIGGGKTYEDAINAKDNFENNTVLREQLISRTNLILSDSVDGLNPNYYIASIGYCEEEDLSDIVLQIANKYMKGVYKRKVKLDKNIVLNNLITVKVNAAPFQGKSNKYQGEAIIVKYEPSLIKRIGSFDINYFLIWNKESGYIQQLSELEFTNISINELDTMSCFRSQYNSNEPDSYLIRCFYPNDIESVYTQDGYGSKESMLFPLTKFSYNEVLCYYLGKGYFKELLENDYFNDSTGMFDYSDEDPFKVEYKIYDTSILRSGIGFPRPLEELKIEGDYIIYEYRIISIE